MKNSFEQKILDQLQKMKDQLSRQQDHINTLEQKLNNPTYEFHSSLAGNETQQDILPKKPWLSFTPIIVLTLFSVIINYWFLKIAWHAPLYQIIPLIYATALIIIGILFKSIKVRITGYLCYIATLTVIIISYKCNHLLHPQTSIILHLLIMSILISLILIFVTMHYRKNNLSSTEKRLLPKSLTIAIPLTLFIWGAAAIILYFDRTSAQPSFFMKPFIEYSRAYDGLIRTDLTQFLLTMYYMFFAFVMIVLGIHYRNVFFRFIGYLVTIFAGYNGWLVIRNTKNIMYLVIISLCAITLLALGLYLYRRKKGK